MPGMNSTKIQNINKYIIGNFLLSEPLLSALRRELRKFADGLKIDNNELQEIIKNEVIKREIFDTEDGKKAESKVNRFLRKATRTTNKAKETPLANEEARLEEIPEPFKTPV